MLTDTHAHLDYPDFAADLAETIARAREAGVSRIITIGTGIESSRRAVALAAAHPEVYAAVGVHPIFVQDEVEDFVPALRELARQPKVVAIGETGLDYHRLAASGSPPAIEALGAGTSCGTDADIVNGATKNAQAMAFRMQLDLAAELGLNVVIHQRDAWRETLAILGDYTGRLRGVFHCFGGGPEHAREVAAMGHLVSFTGIVTFKNAAAVRETAAAVTADGFLLETDCPYLAPAPHRGSRCEPCHTRLIAEAVARVRNSPLEELAAATERTAEAFFAFGR